MGGFELLGTECAQVAVPSRAVVEAVDAQSDVRDREFPVLIDVLLHALFLQAAEKRFRDGVVPAAPLRLMLGSRWLARQNRRHASLSNCLR